MSSGWIMMRDRALRSGGVMLALAACAPALAAPDVPQAARAEAKPRFAIDAFDVAGNTILPQIEIERAVYPHSGPDRTIDDVEAARAALEAAYRQRGYDSVVVDIPAQSADSGILKLQVTEAKVGTVRITGASASAAAKIRTRTPSLQEGTIPNLGEAQTELAGLNRTAHRQVTPLLKPGKEPGTIDVDLKVEEHSPLHGTLQLTNDHSPNTRPLRLLASVRDEDLWGLGHVVSATYVVAPQNRRNAEVFAGSYVAPFGDGTWSALLYGYKSNSNVAALGGTNVLGNGYAVGVRGIVKLPAKGSFSHSLSFGVDFKDFKENTFLSGTIADQAPIRYIPATITYNATIAGDKATLNTSLAITAGLRTIRRMLCRPDGSGCTDEDQFSVKRFNARENFVHINFDADYTRNLGKDFVGVLRLSGQFADGPLVSNEQFAAGGQSTVRGYLQSEAVGDDGVAGTIELRSPSFATAIGDFVDELRLFAFTDAAHVSLRDPLPGQTDNFDLLSVGLGARLGLLKYLTGDVSVAFPLLRGVRDKHPYASFSVKAEY